MAYADLFIIVYLNRSTTWNKRVISRLLAELPASLLVALIISVIFTTIRDLMSPYSNELSNVLISNVLIFSVVNIILVIILEGWLFSIESRKAKETAENLRKELSQVKFEVLKSQINPHFMFNSLNVLSGLISKDKSMAQQFIDEFSLVYRHVLETIEQQVTTLGKELEFARSYLFLQQMRYGESLTYKVKVRAEAMNWLLPPLSLQVVLENALKHNTVNDSAPLGIDIAEEEGFLIVKNKIQPKVSIEGSTGLGLKNLRKRYYLITSQQPLFWIEDYVYIAKLPLLKPDEDESIDN
ncbi:MAG: histidine kinase [Bacteroidales bacterium]|nr:histidine kinase [Bacteroidales bacterium]